MTALPPAPSVRRTPEACDPRQVWQRVLSFLESRTGEAQYETYLRGTLGLAYDPGASVLRVAAANPFHVPWLEGKLSPTIHTAVAEVLGGPIRVEFVATPTTDTNGTNGHQQRVRPAPLLETLERVATPPSYPESRARPAVTHSLGSPLNVRYTFSSFVVGKSNQLAHAASMAVVDDPGRNYNPLFLYGGVGLGKTHLLHAIGHAVTAQNLDVLYVSSEGFTNELIESIRQHRTDDFRAKFRGARVLLIDDVQFIAGKERTEEEFFHTFNAIHESGGQIVLSSDRPPRAMHILEDRLRSRFEWGLIADVQAPDYETRIAILRSKLAGPVLGAVPSDVLDFIAHKVQSNIRELEGSLNRLLAYARHLEQPVTVDLAARALHDLVSPGPTSRGAAPNAILTAVARYFGVKVEDLKGRSRHKHIVVPRHIAMYLLCEDAHMSTPEVGRLLGRDHTTVMHGFKQVANDVARAGPSRATVRGVREVVSVGLVQMPVPREDASD
ncbi:MAG: chromosomal replication initiator protein DnaA [Chloroflexi bacterium]|nr:chromosomal replication initiator protein DnaA [Chloroflexota bacterium]